MDPIVDPVSTADTMLPFESFNQPIGVLPFSQSTVIPTESQAFITKANIIIEPPIRHTESPESDVPLLTKTDDEYQDAIATLMWRNDLQVRSLFDHISAMVRHIFYAKGNTDLWNGKLELLSRLTKRYHVPPVSMHYIKPGYIPPSELHMFQNVRDMFVPFEDDQQRKPNHNGIVPQGIGYVPPEQPLNTFPPSPFDAPTHADDEEGGEDTEKPAAYKPIDIYEWLFYAQETAIGLSRTEMYLAMTALLKFQKRYYADLAKMRFWGKMYGTFNDYYIIECEFKENSEKWLEKPAVLETHPELATHKVAIYNPFGTFGMRDDFQPKLFTLEDPEAKFPVSSTPTIDPDQSFKEIIVEECKVGANLYCYYVCTDLIAAEWLRLPDMTPDQIRKARFIRKGFTGNLDAKIISCPRFPGKEKNYLRAQIARISHGTTIGPIGEFVSLDEEEELPEGAVSANFRLIDNPDFEHPNLHDVLSKNLTSYGHNLPFLLRQGRCSFYDPSPGDARTASEDDNEEEEEPEESEGVEKEKIVKKKLRAKPETGPPVFNPISDDREVGKDIPAWVVRTTNTVLPQNGIVKICSNLWPGAMCLVQTKKSQNFYVGDGLKFGEFTPYVPPLPRPMFNAAMKFLQHATDPTITAEEEKRKKEAAEKTQQEALESSAAEKEEEGETEDEEEEEASEDVK